MPDKLSLEHAACLPEVWLTAYQLLHFVGKIQPGDSVLVHAGGSGVGTAAVQLVKRAGGKSIVTAGSQAKIDLAVKLGADKGVNYREEDFKKVIEKWSNGRGVDIILDCIGGRSTRSSSLEPKLEMSGHPISSIPMHQPLGWTI